jgi:hypothetical protein
MALFVQFLRERVNHLFGEYVALLEELIFFGHTGFDTLRHTLAITLWCQAISRDTMGNEIGHHALGALLRQALVVGIRTTTIGMGRQLDGNVGILIEQHHQLVERRF